MLYTIGKGEKWIMAGIILEKGKQIYESGQPMTALHLITSGNVEVTYPGGTYALGKGDVIGICEICSEVHFLSYSALENTTILTYPLNNMDSLDDLLQKHPDVARLFLLSQFRQINTLQGKCSLSEVNCSNLYRSLTEDYEKYNLFCSRYRISPRSLEGFDALGAYLGDESPDLWLNSYYIGLAHIYASENYKFFVQESSVSLGMLRKGSLDFRKTYQSLDEQFRYIQQLADFYFTESGNDLFDFYTTLYYKLDSDSADAKSILSDINRMVHQWKNISGLDATLLSNRIRAFESNISTAGEAQADGSVDSDIIKELTGSLNTILDFAGMDLDIAASFRQHINAYKALADRSSLDENCVLLRKSLTQEFYILYSVLFEKTLTEANIPMPVWMFLYFGYADEELAGINNAATLYTLAKSMTDHSSLGIYTFYDWLLAIFHGRKEPSRNEFDLDYSDYVHKQKACNNITDAEMRALENNAMSKVNYELRNMFPQVNKMTFGRISTFCPIFATDNVLKDLENSYVTASAVCKAIEQVRKVDYTAFYRESLDMEHLNAMGKETVHLEYLPDIILMPNVGMRGVMWQEIEGKRRNSPGRMVFSIFHLEDLNTSFIRLTGEFRWELCKRIQGSRWNDISDRSLTSEYFDYVQFYRKNHDLSTEAKERVRSSLQRAKNSFKEMFVRDYIIWVMYEGNGSPRLNKVARKILFTYCPFPADICETLAQNPLYTELLQRHKILTAQKLHHLNMLSQKLRNSRIAIPETLEHEFSFVEGKALN